MQKLKRLKKLEKMMRSNQAKDQCDCAWHVPGEHADDFTKELNSHQSRYDTVPPVPAKRSGAHVVLPEGSIAAQLAAAGEALPDGLRRNIVAMGRLVVPELLAMVENDDLSMADAPGAGHVPIHAAELLSDLGASDCSEALLQVLFRCDGLTFLHSKLLYVLKGFGAVVLEPALQACAAAETKEQRDAAAIVLSGIGVRDARILLILLDVFHDNLGIGAGLLADYGDPIALPKLSAALDDYKLDFSGAMFANHDVIEIVEAIERLGGELTDNQEDLLQKMRSAPNPVMDAIFKFAAQSVIRNQ